MSSSSSATSTTTTVTTTSTGSGKTWKDYFGYFLYFLRILTVLTLIMNLIAYCFVIKIGVTSSANDVLQKAFIVLSNIGFCLVVIALIIAEFQFVWFVKRVRILNFWAARGFGQAFMGIQLINSAANAGKSIATDVGGNSEALQTFAEVSGWILFSIGVLMMLMSALCLRDIVKLKGDQELERALLASDAAAVVVHTTGAAVTQGEVRASEAKDKLQKEVENLQTIVQNLSTAMGISYVVASSKFGGKAGAQAAESFQREMKQKEQQLKSAGTAARSEMTRMSGAAETTANSISSSLQQQQSSSSYSPANNNDSYSGGGGSRVNVPNDDDEPVGRRKKAQMDDDELERMYYGK